MTNLSKDRPRWRLIDESIEDPSSNKKHYILVTNSHLKDIQKYVAKKTENLPRYVKRRLIRHYVKIFNKKYPDSNELFANIWLRDVVKPVQKVIDSCPFQDKKWLRNDEAIKKFSLKCANDCLTAVSLCNFSDDYLINLFYCYDQLAAYCEDLAVVPPYKVQVENKVEPAAECAVLRMCCEKWWYRKLIRIQRQTNEHILIVIGEVQKKISPYISAEALSDWKSQQKANRDYMQNMELVKTDFDADTGQEFELIYSMAEMFEASSANPKNRFTELMVRCRGLENLSLDDNYIGLFLTITAPSKYHATTKNGRANPKYIGVNPKQTQAYLMEQWAKIRAKLKRDEVLYYGVRVVEPHHDATPHWHLLLFVCPEQAEQLINTCKKYAFEIDGHEDGAAKHRFTVEKIDPSKGSATGYIAKYLSKNIDGEYIKNERSKDSNNSGVSGSDVGCGVVSDVDNSGRDYDSGKSASEGAKRATAWASRWNLRQFQFFGAEPVTIYREARRIKQTAEDIEVEKIRQAVESTEKLGKWYAFTKAMRESRINLAYELSQNDYAESVRKIKGLISKTGYEETRESGFVLRKRGSGSPWSPVINCTGRKLEASITNSLGFDEDERALLSMGCKVSGGFGLVYQVKNGRLNEYRV